MLQRLAEAVQRLRTRRVLVLGDLMLDRYVWGAVHRVSPEAPVQILSAQREEGRPGGAANVATNLAVLGSRATCVGVAGRDEAASQLIELLNASGVRSVFIRDGARPTAVKTRMIAHNQQMLRVDQEKAVPIDAATERKVLAVCASAAERHDIAVLSDYDKGTLTPRVCQKVIRAFRTAGKPVLVGLKRRDHLKYRGATGGSLNRGELVHLTGTEDAERGAKALLRALRMRFLIVTLGERGMLVVEGKRSFRLPALARQVYDVTGAGDTVLSAFAAAFSSGLGLEECAVIANAAAGIVVGKVGTATVSREELLSYAQGGDGVSHRKFLTGKALVEALEAERGRGRSIVMTNGCFDLLHPGHVRLLQFAKSRGDVLVVAINTDRSVRALKGPERPLQSEGDRATVLSALECVDYVTLFDDDTPVRLLKLIRPNVLVKGGDYTADQVVGREHVEAYGGRVELAPHVKGQSTSGLVRKMRSTT